MDLLSSKNSDKLLLTIIYTLGISFSLISFIWNINILIKTNVLLGLFALFILGRKNSRNHFIIYILFWLIFISFIFSSFFVGRFGWRFFTPLHFLVPSYAFSLILIRKAVYNWGAYIVFYSLAFYFLILMFFGVNGEFALKWSSSNGISIVILIACVSFYIILNNEK